MTPFKAQFTSDTYNVLNQTNNPAPLNQPPQDETKGIEVQKQQPPQMRQRTSSASSNAIQLDDKCAPGQWTKLHLEAAYDPKKIPELVASGAPIDALNGDGFTLLMYFIKNPNAEAVASLLAAGANPLFLCNENTSPLHCALSLRSDLAIMIVKSLPNDTKVNFLGGNLSELHEAVFLPEVLLAMLAKGMQDNHFGGYPTALCYAAQLGQSISVKHLLEYQQKHKSKSNFQNYLDGPGATIFPTALPLAIDSKHFDIAEILMHYGAKLTPSDESRYLRDAMNLRDIALLEFLLKNSSASFKTDLSQSLNFSVSIGWVKGVAELAKAVNLSTPDQIKLLNLWKKNSDADMLDAISHAIGDAACSMKTLVEHPNILKRLVQHHDIDLLISVLKFFEHRDSFDFIIQSAISYLIEDIDGGFDSEQGEILLQFMLQPQQVPKAFKNDQTMMRLLQLSDRLKNYSLVTEIKQADSSASWLNQHKSSFHPEWISDPIAREFLGIRDGEYGGLTSNLIKTMKSFVFSSDYSVSTDGEQLANDLKFALKVENVDASLKKVFDAYDVSAFIRQALIPILQGLTSQLYPDPVNRNDAVCNFLIAYAFFTLKDNPWVNLHPAFTMMQSDQRWTSMNEKVQGEIESLEQVGATIIDKMVYAKLWQTLPDNAAQLTVDSLTEVEAKSFLTVAFSSLGMLDAVADRLAQSCMHAAQAWRSQNQVSIHSGKTTEAIKMQLKALISKDLEVMKSLPKLSEQLINSVMKVDSYLNQEFHAMFWWQLELIYRAFGIVTEQDLVSGSNNRRDSQDSAEKTAPKDS